nr:GlsB/YeaQ/YmgE family stress response membrane protein [uncultured Dongia sp.]
MGWLAWILFGLIAGIIAKFIMPGRDPGGIFVTIIIGIVGAMLGGWLATQFGLGAITGFDIRSFLIAVAGSLILLFIYRRIRS